MSTKKNTPPTEPPIAPQIRKIRPLLTLQLVNKIGSWHGAAVASGGFKTVCESFRKLTTARVSACPPIPTLDGSCIGRGSGIRLHSPSPPSVGISDERVHAKLMSKSGSCSRIGGSQGGTTLHQNIRRHTLVTHTLCDADPISHMRNHLLYHVVDETNSCAHVKPTNL